LDKKSETLKIIQQLRDEAHRFGITAHRKKRDKGTLVTELHIISGIGKVTADNLLKYFKSVKKIKEATEEELLEVVNLKQAKAIKSYFAQTSA
jgi:excinuclease ABC subunit C